jgi:AcrR family transcriptional regulator
MRYRRSMSEVAVDGSRDAVRRRLVDVAARLLAERGPAAVTTRGVAQAAGVQAPTIYRLFGDKDGLLEAVAEQVMATYVTAKSATAGSAGVDPVADLRAGWDAHIAFGLANPALFALLHDPARAATSPAAAAGLDVLRVRVRRVAAAGRLCTGERRAVELVHAAGTGVVLTLLALAPQDRDPGLADAAWAAVAQSVLTDGPAPPAADGVASAVRLRAVLPELPALSEAERALMAEWLDRAIGA